VSEHYAIVLADLHWQAKRIQTAIDAIRSLHPITIKTDASTGKLLEWAYLSPLREDEMTFVAPEYREPSLHITSIEDAPTPPPPKRVIPTDPEELKGLALNLSHQGYGLGEIKTMLELTAAQMQDFFATDV
jgi:hypothetical protein